MTRLALVSASLIALAAASTASAQEVKWGKDYEAGLKEAKASKKLVMVDFFTEW